MRYNFFFKKGNLKSCFTCSKKWYHQITIPVYISIKKIHAIGLNILKWITWAKRTWLVTWPNPFKDPVYLEECLGFFLIGITSFLFFLCFVLGKNIFQLLKKKPNNNFEKSEIMFWERQRIIFPQWNINALGK